MSFPTDGMLRTARAAGLFAAARRLTAGRLRILCYHGIALGDEYEFQPMLFMRPQTFRARLERLVRDGYPVLPLTDALEQLRRNTLPPCAVAITIDDGWYGTYRDMAPALARFGLPATLYLSTYYMQRQTQVFGVAAAYALWRSQPRTIELAALDKRLSGRFDLAVAADRDDAARQISALADRLETAAERQELLARLYAELRLPLDEVRGSRRFAFMTAAEAREVASGGIDLQQHTHRHRFPAGRPNLIEAEIQDNRAALSELGSGPFRHLCYPSGEYDREAFGLLASLGIESATTTEQGMNGPDSHPLGLRRFLDSDAISQIRFEAEMSGFLDLLRRYLRRNQSVGST
jgi:peptidoglycan/xylan/chitin deacetylase (PgdA/CDA1 family)